jgi:hypothetical protein
MTTAQVLGAPGGWFCVGAIALTGSLSGAYDKEERSQVGLTALLWVQTVRPLGGLGGLEGDRTVETTLLASLCSAVQAGFYVVLSSLSSTTYSTVSSSCLLIL